MHGAHGGPGIHVLAGTYHLAVTDLPDDGRWHVEGMAVAFDGAVVIQLGDRYASACMHLFDVEPKAVQLCRHRGHSAVQELLPAPVLLHEDRVVPGWVPLDVVVGVGGERVQVAR